MKYRKKPVVIDAIRWTGDNTLQMEEFATTKVEYAVDGCLLIDTLEGVMKANVGDYVIKGISGEFYPCKPDIFEATYEKVEAVKPSEIKVTVSVDNVDEIIARFAEKVEEHLNQVAE